jgi:hypothetical protein
MLEVRAERGVCSAEREELVALVGEAVREVLVIMAGRAASAAAVPVFLIRGRVQQAQEDLVEEAVARMEELPDRRLRLSAVYKAVPVATMVEAAVLPPVRPSSSSTDR